MANKEIVAMREYFGRVDVRSRFADVVGDQNVGSYVTSVMTAVAGDPKLQKCSIESVFISGIRAATLQLTVDPSLGHAYLVPFGGKCTLIPGYKGLRELALRTGRYNYINVSPLFEGQEPLLDPLTGFYEVDKRGKKSNTLVGWFGSFRLFDGFLQHFYMTIEEIHAHKEQYSPGWDRKDSAWKTNTAKMEKKTVMRQLLDMGPLNPNDRTALTQIETDTNGIDAPDPAKIIEGKAKDNKSADEHIAEVMGEKYDGDIVIHEANANLLLNDGILPADEFDLAVKALKLSALPLAANNELVIAWGKTFAGYYFDPDTNMNIESAAKNANIDFEKAW